MVASHHFGRVDTLELKDQIYRKIGHERAKDYFDQLKRFLNLQLNKAEFDKSCVQTLGRDNISLHNQLIRSIIQNAHNAKTPPQKPKKVDGLGIRFTENYQKNHLQSHKCKSPANRKFRADRPSPLGPLGKSTSVTYEETVTRINESPTELHSLSSKPPFVEDGEEVEQLSENFCNPRWSHVTAPFGVSMHLDGERKSSGVKHGVLEGFCQTSGELPDTMSLRNRLEKKLALEGLGISMDCCNLLNKGLDVFLKRLFEPCIELRHGIGSGNNQMIRGNYGKRPLKQTFVSMLNFQVAMESNPRLLGKNWPTQFERSPIILFEGESAQLEGSYRKTDSL